MPGTTFVDGDGVQLRTIERADLEFMQEAVNDQTLRQAIGRVHPVNESQEEEFYEEIVCGDESVNLLVTADGTRAGTVGFNDIDHRVGTAELGYWIAPDQQRQGYGSEAVGLMIDYGFRELGFHRIEARVFEFNTGSRRLLESLGFTQEGVHRDAQFVHGEYQDVYWYGLLEDEFERV